jgi:hypothetical protein
MRHPEYRGTPSHRFAGKIAVVLLVGAAILSQVQAAHASQLHVIGTLPNAYQVETAVAGQMNNQVSHHWPGLTVTTFNAAAGDPVYMIGSLANTAARCDSPWDPNADELTAGCHSPIVGIIVGPDDRAITLSHEVMESAVDPSCLGPEISDPVEGNAYQFDGVWVDDFVYPAYFSGGPGPWDQMGMLHRNAGRTWWPSAGKTSASSGTVSSRG